ncbi:PREDICTED: uncharacterized protein LOC104734018 [Camelina sativa]|uniref:Uncharacterized protein LOC104734018 n=1 Tax=Camelina sativa TaxID=90675 RepID=A0ABM0V6V4_CAMSA|nr:PREDICTED: uncharacterized protein LOC104734018 [Camelina sativa]
MEFNKHFGKFRSLWAEFEMLRPNTMDPAVLNERREQDKVFALLLTVNPTFNDLIKHILRSDKLPSLDDVCSQIQKEQGSLGLFSGKGELVTANKGVFKPEDQRAKGGCEHCKRKNHTKEKCWFLHPHLRPNHNNNGPRANHTHAKEEQGEAGSSKGGEETTSGDYVKKSDLEAFFKSLALKESSGKTFFTLKPNNSLVVDSGPSHHMISNSNLLNNIEPARGSVIIANGDKISIQGVGNLKLFNKESKAFYMPKFTSNLLSVKRATNDLNFYAIFGPNDVYFQDIESGKLIGEGGTKDDLYVLEDISPSSPKSFSLSSHLGVSFNVMWHARLGHPHSRALELMIPNVSFDHLVAKLVSLAHIVKPDNNKYVVTFIDEKSKYTWVTLLPSKDRVIDAFTNFQNYVTNQFNAKIKVFRKDNGVPVELRNKLEAKSIKCIFLGYSITQKGYKCFDPINKRTWVSHDVKFLEEQGYFDKKDWEDLKDLATQNDQSASLRFLLDHLGASSTPNQTMSQDTTPDSTGKPTSTLPQLQTTDPTDASHDTTVLEPEGEDSMIEEEVELVESPLLSTDHTDPPPQPRRSA